MSERDWPEIVRRLRAKAASTQFPEEREALAARADALAAKYCTAEPARPRGPMDFSPEERAAFEEEQERLIEEWMAQEQQRFQQWAAHQRVWQGRPVTGTSTQTTADGFVVTITF